MGPFLSERDFAKPTTSITIPARAAYPHAFNLVLATFAAAMPSSLAFPDKLLRHSLRQWTAGAVMGRLLNEILLRSCMAAFAIGVVIAAASLLG